MSKSYASKFWCNVNEYHDLVKDYEQSIDKNINFYENIDFPSVNFAYSVRYEYNGEAI